jgi:hypothetical protein
LGIDIERRQEGDELPGFKFRHHTPKREHIEWRRNQVLEFASQGRTEREIAQILKVGNGTVHRDIAYLNKQALDNLRYHIQERLPAQYLKCQNGLDQVLKMAWNMIITDSINQSDKLQALSLISFIASLLSA